MNNNLFPIVCADMLAVLVVPVLIKHILNAE